MYDGTAPIISQTTPVSTPTNINTPIYEFTSDGTGTITYAGACSSADTTANIGVNTITFNALADGTHSDCTIVVTDLADNDSNTLSVSPFTVDTQSPTVAITSSETSPTNNNPIPVTITFNESVIGFDNTDISLTNGSVTSFA